MYELLPETCYSSHIESYVPPSDFNNTVEIMFILIVKIQLKSLHSVLSLHKGLV